MSDPGQAGRTTPVLLNLLPAMYQEQMSVAEFLRPFEMLLFDNEASDPPSIDAVIRSLSGLIDPLTTQERFVPWLASWMAVALHPDLEPDRRRLLVQHATTLYRRRGTRRGLEQLIAIVTGAEATVLEPEMTTFRVGASRVGETTRLGGERPHYFEVRLTVPAGLDDKQQARLTRLARAYADLAKPAHTQYSLVVTANRPAPPPKPVERS